MPARPLARGAPGLGPEVLAADVAVLDINLGSGQPSGIDAYDWLMSENFGGRLLFLTGHAHAHPLVARAERLRRATVLDKPLDGQVLLDTDPGRRRAARRRPERWTTPPRRTARPSSPPAGRPRDVHRRGRVLAISRCGAARRSGRGDPDQRGARSGRCAPAGLAFSRRRSNALFLLVLVPTVVMTWLVDDARAAHSATGSPTSRTSSRR